MRGIYEVYEYWVIMKFKDCIVFIWKSFFLLLNKCESVKKK